MIYVVLAAWDSIKILATVILSLHLVTIERDEEARPLHLVAGLEPPRPEDGQRLGVVAELPLRCPNKSVDAHFETES